MSGRTSLYENYPSREGQGQKGSETFNNRFDFERGLWWREMGAGDLGSTKERLVNHLKKWTLHSAFLLMPRLLQSWGARSRT